MDLPDPFKSFSDEGSKLFVEGCVHEVIFSEGTYQIEVEDQKEAETFWPFLQFDSEDHLLDYFCSCSLSEEKGACPHLVAAFIKIHEKGALHIRFKHSFYNAIFQMASRRLGYMTKVLKKEDQAYVGYSKTRKELVTFLPKSKSAKKKLKEWIDERVKETEETSLKFSNLSMEEMEAYREGRASHHLRYELSFWSDIAKWLFLMEDEVRVNFQNGEDLPKSVQLISPEIEIEIYISRATLSPLIESIKTVSSNLKVHDSSQSQIESITYDAQHQRFHLHKKNEAKDEKAVDKKNEIAIGEWVFVPHDGFYNKTEETLLSKDVIEKEEIKLALSAYPETFQKRLKNVKLSPDVKPMQYHLSFDKKKGLHIQSFLIDEEDFKKELSAFFLPWVYIEGRGFFLTEDVHFTEKEKWIALDELSDFITKKRVWLHQFEGFQSHFGSIEAHLHYEVTQDEALLFSSELDITDNLENMVDLGSWVYIQGLGFYMKKGGKEILTLRPGLEIKKEKVSEFIYRHHDELLAVERFFMQECPIEKVGLSITLTEDKKILVKPEKKYAAGFSEENVKFFGDFAFVEGKGFYELAKAFNLPEKYREEKLLNSEEESFFLHYEIERLKPFTTHIETRLTKPHFLELKVRKLIKERKRRKDYWLSDLYYESDLGLIDLVTLWKEVIANKKYAFTNAGLIFLTEDRFNWMRQISKKRLHKKHELLRLTTIEWMRLCIMEDVKEPVGQTEENIRTRKLMGELSSFEALRLLDIKQLKSTLWPYQELGLQWLWFLYCHGLSGLLSDEMGLGKTHQAMALLAAVSHEDRYQSYKYLVVCPTSVIYHWQDLLERYLPALKVLSYHGIERSLEGFEKDYDLLLTSYGILRTGKENLKPYHFEIAIFDEIQVAKNHLSQTHLSLRQIQANMKLGLTGTPIENRIREIKALYDIVLPNYLPKEKDFRQMFVLPIEKRRDPDKKELLSRLIKPFILRRKKVEVLLELPEKMEEVAYCDLSDEQKKLYREIAENKGKAIVEDMKEEKAPVPYTHIFSLLTKLKQVCNHPSLILGDENKYYKHDSGKWELFTELIHEARESGQKVVVFSQYLSMLKIIESYLKKKGIGFASIKGSTKNRKEQLKRFKEDPECEIFVASLLAAGVGIDLSSASIVIHYDRWWNPAKEDQATDRVHRIGQSRGVQVFKLVSKNTIEEDIHAIIDRKKGLIEETVGKDDSDQIKLLSKEELIEIIQKTIRE